MRRYIRGWRRAILFASLGVVSLAVLGGAIWQSLPDIMGGHLPFVAGLSAPKGLPPAMALDAQAGRLVLIDPGRNAVDVLDTRSGRFLPSLSLGFPPNSVALDARTGRAIVITASTVATIDVRSARLLQIFKGDLLGSLKAVALDERRGSVIASVDRSPLPDAVVVFAGPREWPVGHTPRWSPSTSPFAQAFSGGGYPHTLAVDRRTGNILVIQTANNALHIVDGRTGKILHITALSPAPVAEGVDPQRGTVFVASRGSNTVSVISMRTGAILRTIPVPIGPSALAVDERTQHVFVASDGRYTPSPVIKKTKGGWIISVPLVTNGGDPVITILDARSGKRLRIIPLASIPTAIAVDSHAGRIFVATQNSSLVANAVLILDSRNGHIICTLPLGVSH